MDLTKRSKFSANGSSCNQKFGCEHATNKVVVLPRKLVTNAYIDGGDRIDICSEKNNILLHKAFSKLSLWEIAEWFMQKDEEVLDAVIYKIAAKRLFKGTCKCDDLNDQEKRLLQKCIKHCFRGVLLQRSGVDLKILKTLLKLQREFVVTAYQQFIWFCLLPNAFKEKWALLASVIPALKHNEICSCENILMSVLWRAQARHSSGSVTSDCLLMWFINDNSDHQSCARFLANCLVSSNRLRRLNCSRFWLAKFNTNSKSKMIMNETAKVILEMIAAESHSFEQTKKDYYLTEEEMYHLIYKDHFISSKNDESVWMRYDRLLYGWLSVQKFFIRELESSEIELMRQCLTSYHPSLRLDALELLNKLMNKELLNWSRQFGSIKSFVLQNLDTTDSKFCNTLLNLVRNSNAKARKRLERTLLEELDSSCNDRDRPNQIIFILELLKQCSFDRWLCSTHLMDSVFNSDISEIRIKLLMCLSLEDSDSQIFLTEEFVKMLNSDNVDGLGSVVKAMLRYKELKDILDLIKESECKDSNGVKITLTTLIEDFPVQFVLVPSYWMGVCIKSNFNLILSSGSHHNGQCSPLPELYERLYPLAFQTLMIGDQQRKAIDKYYHTLKVNCEMLASLCETTGTRNIITDACDSVWNVLMRSRHKGVVNDCAICFNRIITCCMVNNLRDVICLYLEKTKTLFASVECTTRNLAFCLVFKIFYEVLGSVNSFLDFMFESIRACTPVLAVRLMKILKAFLCVASFDVTDYAVKIFKSLLDFYRAGNSMVRNAACHCYAALVYKLVDDVKYGTPLFTFVSQHDLLWNEYCKQLEQTTVHDPALILLLSLLSTLRFVSESFYTTAQLKHLQSMVVSKLVSLLVVSPNLRINRLIVSSLLHLVPCACRRKLAYRLKRIVERKLPLNINNSLNYAISKLEAMDFLDTPSDPLYSFGSLSIALLPSLIKTTHKILIDSCFVCFERFGILLTEIENHAYSSKEIYRLYAAHALLILSRISCTMLIDFSFYRYRFVSCCRSLLLDEADCIKRVAFCIVNACGGGTNLSYFWDPSTVKKIQQMEKTRISFRKHIKKKRPIAFERSK